MENLPTLAVITRLSRPARYVERVLDGLLLQTGAQIHWSIISQIELGEEYAHCFERAKANNIQVTITKAAPNITLGELANLGVNATESEYLILHDDDDALRGDFVGTAMRRLRSDKTIVGVTCHAAIIHEIGSDLILDFVLSPGVKRVCETTLVQDNLMVTNALIYRRTGFEAADGYPQDVTVAEDWLFNIALIAEGDIVILPKIYAEVYIRGKRSSSSAMNIEATHQNTVVTHQTDHIEMETRIRKDPYNPTAIIRIDRQAHNQAFHQRLRRFVDRITYKTGGWYLPRF